MKMVYQALGMLFLGVPLGACDRASDTSDTSSNSGPSGPACELASVVELANADVVAPNGRTASELLAAIPESFQTTLHWDLSNSSVEVEVDGASGQSSTLNLTFTLPPEPKFYFEDRVISPSFDKDVEVICEDYVKTTLDLRAETQDGALSFELLDVEVRLGPDDPESGSLGKPFVIATETLMSPVVGFVAPVAQVANSEKDVVMSFDTPGITGEITAYATGSNETHQIIVARW